MGRCARVWLLCGLLGWAGVGVQGAEQIKVLALFPGKAMLSIDGERRLVRVGETTPEGVKLVSASSREAVLEVDGQAQEHRLASHIGGSYAAAPTAEIKILRDRLGSYSTTGRINGRTVRLLVDTGASTVAMSSVEAERLGIDFREKGTPVTVSTAGGNTRGYALNLEHVKVGAIELPNVGAVVIEGDNPAQVLLGMTFLGRVDMEHQGHMLRLKKKY